MNKLISYYAPIHTAENYTLSIDKMVVDYIMTGADALTALGKMLDNLPIRYAVEIKHYESFRVGTFRGNYTITFQNHNSFWLGVALNSSKTEWNRVRLEINPNKCANHASFLEILEFLNTNSRPNKYSRLKKISPNRYNRLEKHSQNIYIPVHTKIKRFDLAVDVPVEREKARLIRDRRVYTERIHGAEWTEYLGAQASHVGRVKMYNKQLEARLNYPLTRLEVTLNPETAYEKQPWPKAYYVRGQPVGKEEIKLTETERFILTALLAGYGSPKELGRKTREKMELVLNEYVKYIKIGKSEYTQIKGRLRTFLEYPQKELELERIDSDQPRRGEEEVTAWEKEAERSDEETRTEEPEP